ncbi:DUF4349 domain-containing protein [Phytoactinopolyspora halotolerans]|uniref:DUF4349 domain-containing protein n=1 Tax=Phytoactinopolyspora halotolerans TaxID=1981512 RepID=A0A6L9S8D3_9ACTN|nr:DUF4349 domain-containing protein [Phytoactinopolyspora halotolerans]NEE01283.1 DUF4349 domain-containing protein [Phytoactinopolyspora halotolerans]
MKRRTAAAYAAAATLLTLTACSSGNDDEGAAGDSAPAAEAPAQGSVEQESDAAAEDDSAGSGDAARSNADSSDSAGGVITQIQNDAINRNIIYTVDLRIDTEDAARAADEAAKIARTAGGFVAEENTTPRTSSLTLRIPTDEYNDAVRDLQELGDVVDRGTTTQDVTQQVVDTESRIDSQRQSIARIRELLDEATDLSDVISIESELASREADLDSLLSQQERLSDLTSLATVNVTFAEERDDEDEEEDGETFGFASGLSGGWDAFTTTLSVAAGVLAAMLPFLVLLALLGVPVWIWHRRRRPTPSAAGDAALSPPA